jgi:hypothetical protein
MRRLLEALERGMKPEEFGHEFREHMQAIWLDCDRAGLITIELRHAHTNLADAMDAFEFDPEPSPTNAVRSRFVVYENVAAPSQQPTKDS